MMNNFFARAKIFLRSKYWERVQRDGKCLDCPNRNNIELVEIGGFLRRGYYFKIKDPIKLITCCNSQRQIISSNRVKVRLR